MAFRIRSLRGTNLETMRFAAGGLTSAHAPERATGRIGYAMAARYIGVPLSTLYVLVSRRQVPHLRLSKRLVVFETSELDRWLDERRQ